MSFFLAFLNGKRTSESLQRRCQIVFLLAIQLSPLLNSNPTCLQEHYCVTNHCLLKNWNMYTLWEYVRYIYVAVQHRAARVWYALFPWYICVNANYWACVHSAFYLATRKAVRANMILCSLHFHRQKRTSHFHEKGSSKRTGISFIQFLKYTSDCCNGFKIPTRNLGKL